MRSRAAHEAAVGWADIQVAIQRARVHRLVVSEHEGGERALDGVNGLEICAQPVAGHADRIVHARIDPQVDRVGIVRIDGEDAHLRPHRNRKHGVHLCPEPIAAAGQRCAGEPRDFVRAVVFRREHRPNRDAIHLHLGRKRLGHSPSLKPPLRRRSNSTRPHVFRSSRRDGTGALARART